MTEDETNKETEKTIPNQEPTTPTETPGTEETKESPIERADKQIAELKMLNAERKELLEREEKLEASKKLGGRSQAGGIETPQLSEEERASQERIKEVGKATGAKWADDMDKKDGN